MTNKIYELINRIFGDCDDALRMIYRDLIIELVVRSDDPTSCAEYLLSFGLDTRRPFHSNHSLTGMSDEVNDLLKPYIQRQYHESPQNTPGDPLTAEWKSHKENRIKGRHDNVAPLIRAMYKDYDNSEYTDMLHYLSEKIKIETL